MLIPAQDDFVQSKATPEAKRAFVKAIIGFVHAVIFVDLLVLTMTMTMSRSRSPKKTREAAQQFTLVARGLEGTSFGYASVIV
jgi:hypothetical protein